MKNVLRFLPAVVLVALVVVEVVGVELHVGHELLQLLQLQTSDIINNIFCSLHTYLVLVDGGGPGHEVDAVVDVAQHVLAAVVPDLTMTTLVHSSRIRG